MSLVGREEDVVAVRGRTGGRRYYACIYVHVAVPCPELRIHDQYRPMVMYLSREILGKAHRFR